MVCDRVEGCECVIGWRVVSEGWCVIGWRVVSEGWCVIGWRVVSV